jgi:hypothetical protein
VHRVYRRPAEFIRVFGTFFSLSGETNLPAPRILAKSRIGLTDKYPVWGIRKREQGRCDRKYHTVTLDVRNGP